VLHASDGQHPAFARLRRHTRGWELNLNGAIDAPWRQSFARRDGPALFELELEMERLVEEDSDPLGVQPGGGAGRGRRRIDG